MYMYPVLGQYLNNYVVHVCPIKRQPEQCLTNMRIPPLLRQAEIVDMVDQVPDVGTLKGLVMETMAQGEDVGWIMEHLPEYIVWDKLYTLIRD